MYSTLAPDTQVQLTRKYKKRSGHVVFVGEHPRTAIRGVFYGIKYNQRGMSFARMHSQSSKSLYDIVVGEDAFLNVKKQTRLKFYLMQRVKLINKNLFGTIRYIGYTQFSKRKEILYGVELDKPLGKHNGTYKGALYFRCDAHKGIFLRESKILPAGVHVAVAPPSLNFGQMTPSHGSPQAVSVEEFEIHDADESESDYFSSSSSFTSVSATPTSTDAARIMSKYAVRNDVMGMAIKTPTTADTEAILKKYMCIGESEKVTAPQFDDYGVDSVRENQQRRSIYQFPTSTRKAYSFDELDSQWSDRYSVSSRSEMSFMATPTTADADAVMSKYLAMQDTDDLSPTDEDAIMAKYLSTTTPSDHEMEDMPTTADADSIMQKYLTMRTPSESNMPTTADADDIMQKYLAMDSPHDDFADDETISTPQIRSAITKYLNQAKDFVDEDFMVYSSNSRKSMSLDSSLIRWDDDICLPEEYEIQDECEMDEDTEFPTEEDVENILNKYLNNEQEQAGFLSIGSLHEERAWTPDPKSIAEESDNEMSEEEYERRLNSHTRSRRRTDELSLDLSVTGFELEYECTITPSLNKDLDSDAELDAIMSKYV